MTKNVIVFGASGSTGQLFCKELKVNKINQTVFLRKASQQKIENLDINRKYGDVLNTEEVIKAFKGETFSNVVIALGNKDLKGTQIRLSATKHIIDAIDNNSGDTNNHVL